ncbi:UDP-N-acetylglucosamine transferase subunit ALG14 homolog isoform X2 [Aotus nancymaae]|uniref:UDP-N-acetylglucosamine transferase subunit ALG14 homolog isoform X2 n=1 Tax=Aotus nancymaae TaxID=37293 RepID=UPI0030FE1A5A
MVCVLLAAAAGAVAVFLILRIWVVLHSRDVTPRESLSILVVAGSGGHTTEILRLLGSLSNAYSPRHYVIADTDEMSANKINSFELDRANRDPGNMYTKYYIHRIPRSREVQQSWPSTVLTTLHSMWLSLPLIHQVKPDLAQLDSWIVMLLLGPSLSSSLGSTLLCDGFILKPFTWWQNGCQ